MVINFLISILFTAGPDSSASQSEFAGGLVPRQALTLTLPYIIDVAEQMKIII